MTLTILKNDIILKLKEILVETINETELKIYNIKDKLNFLPEIIELTKKEWGKEILNETELEIYKRNKMIKIKEMLEENDYCKLILLFRKKLIGFVSIFKEDGEYRKDLTPWYSTMYIKKEYRGNGYSKILNDAILKEAKNRNSEKIYLKTNLNNFYEKYGFIYIEDLPNGEKLYFKALKENYETNTRR